MAPSYILGGLAARALRFLSVSQPSDGSSRPVAIQPTASLQLYESNATASVRTLLLPEYYNENTGVWGDGWWTAACSMATLAEYGSLSPSQANKMNIGGLLFN